MTQFKEILAHALCQVASEHGLSYGRDEALAWGETGASYLSYVLCSLPSTAVRTLQYAARDSYGPILLDCKWYNRLTELCMDGKDSETVLIPSANGENATTTMSKQLFLEMLDFCREG